MSREVPRIIIVDDIDPRIQYNGPWFPDVGSQDSVGDLGPPFRSTLHGTQSNASFEFSYNGSNIQTQLFLTQLNNWLFCVEFTIPEGPHILTVNATVMRNQTFWFADIRYIPSASTPLDQEIILVDSTDPQLQYGEGWQVSSSSSTTNTTGSTFAFNFIGGSISWYGAALSDPSPTTYSIDGQTPIDFFLNGTYIGFNQRYFETAQLPVEPHTLEVVHRGKNATRLILDYLVVQNGTLPSIATPVPSHAISTTAPFGTIFGSVIGGLALIVLGLLLLRRYKRRGAEGKVLSSTSRTSDFELPLLSSSRALDKKAEALAASESQPGSDIPPTMVSMQSNDTKSPDVGVHKDNGIPMPPAENVIMEVPPLYTVEDESLVSHEKDISNNLYI